MNKKFFFKNIGSILLFSFLGTFLAIFISAALFWVAGYYGLATAFDAKVSMAFGALISATDPVSVLAIFGEMGADINLYSIVFGESIFNDAVAVVVYDIVVHMDWESGDKSSYIDELKAGSIKFLIVFIGSICLGAFIALLVAFTLKRQKSHLEKHLDKYRKKFAVNKIYDANSSHFAAKSFLRQRTKVMQEQKDKSAFTEITVMMLAPWVCYVAAGSFQLSGIVAILTCGVFLSYYAKMNISTHSAKIMHTVYEVTAYTSETVVFVFLGVAVFAIDHPIYEIGWGTIITTFVNLNLARFINVFLCSWIVNYGRDEGSQLTYKMQGVMWYSGLRGAMAVALALQAASKLDNGRIVLLDTIIYSLFTILVQASFLNPILIKAGVVGPPISVEDVESAERVIHSKKKVKRCMFMRRMKKMFLYFDQLILAPIFIKDYKPSQHKQKLLDLE